MQKVTVFSRTQAKPGKPQVLAYLLLDEKGNEICRASVLDVQTVAVDHDARAVLPQRVLLVWNAQKIELRMRLYDTQANGISARRPPSSSAAPTCPPTRRPTSLRGRTRRRATRRRCPSSARC